MTLQSNLWKLKAIRLFFWMHFFAAVLIPFYTVWAKLPLSAALYLNAWFMAWNVVLEVPTGTVADYVSRKTSFALGSLVAMTAAFVYAVQPDFRWFLLGEVLFATAYTLHSGADDALGYDSLKALGKTNEAKRLSTRLESFKLAGILIAAVVGGWVASRYGYPTVMRLYMLPAFVSFVLAVSLSEAPIESKKERPSYIETLKDGFSFFRRHPIVQLLAFEAAITNALAWAIVWLAQPLLMKVGIPIQYFGLILVPCCLSQIVFLSNVERLERWFGSKRRLLVGSSAAAGMCFLLLAVPQPIGSLILVIALTFMFGLTRVPIFIAYLNHYIPSEHRTTVLSVTSMIRTLAIVICNPLIGLLSDRSVSLAVLFIGLTLIGLTAASRIEEKHLMH